MHYGSGGVIKADAQDAMFGNLDVKMDMDMINQMIA
jgi:hypothetical protein